MPLYILQPVSQNGTLSNSTILRSAGKVLKSLQHWDSPLQSAWQEHLSGVEICDLPGRFVSYRITILLFNSVKGVRGCCEFSFRAYLKTDMETTGPSLRQNKGTFLTYCLTACNNFVQSQCPVERNEKCARNQNMLCTVLWLFCHGMVCHSKQGMANLRYQACALWTCITLIWGSVQWIISICVQFTLLCVLAWQCFLSVAKELLQL